MNEWMNEWMNEIKQPLMIPEKSALSQLRVVHGCDAGGPRMNEWMNEWINKRTNERNKTTPDIPSKKPVFIQLSSWWMCCWRALSIMSLQINLLSLQSQHYPVTHLNALKWYPMIKHLQVVKLCQHRSAETRYDGLVQERRNSIANALELRLSCTNPSIWSLMNDEGTEWMITIHSHGVNIIQEFNSSPLDKTASTFADDIFRCIFVNEKFYI